MVVAGEEISEEIVKPFVGVVVASGHDGIKVAVHFGVLKWLVRIARTINWNELVKKGCRPGKAIKRL